MPRRSGAPDWISALDFRRALRNCHLDFLGDWYRDPWGWAEVDWAVSEALEDVVIPRTRATGVRHVAKLDVAKENFSVRPAMVMDPIDRLCYQVLTDALSMPLIGDLSPWAYGWRLPRRSATKGNYRSNGREWESYRRHLELIALEYEAALKTDIVSFFSSIPIARIAEDILDQGRNAIAERLVDMIAGFDAVHGRSGLPQRSAASAALANFYLKPLDQRLERHAKTKRQLRGIARRGRVLRWMDDMWIFGPNPASLRKAQVSLQKALEDLGLHMNIAKTGVLEGADVVENVYRVEHSAVDGGLSRIPRDVTPLDELVDRVLSQPEHADRTSVKFATLRMRRHRVFMGVHRLEHSPTRHDVPDLEGAVG